MKTTKINEMRNASEYCKNWFTGNDFFNTTIETSSQKNFFITSERYDDDAPKKYSIRYYNDNTKKILTVGDFQAYKSIDNARMYKRLLIHAFSDIRKNGGHREKNILENADNIEFINDNHNNKDYLFKIYGIIDNEVKFFLININTLSILG